MKITFKLVQRTACCSCGDQITVKGTNPSKAIALWREGHKGPGCGVCDRRTAVRARVKRAAAAAERLPDEAPLPDRDDPHDSG